MAKNKKEYTAPTAEQKQQVDAASQNGSEKTEVDFVKELTAESALLIANLSFQGKTALAGMLSQVSGFSVEDVLPDKLEDSAKMEEVDAALANKLIDGVRTSFASDAKETGNATLLIATHAAATALLFYDEILRVSAKMEGEPSEENKKTME